RRVASVRRAQEAFLVKLEGVEDRTAAERLRGAAVCVPRSGRVPLPEGTYYVDDLLGSEVVTEEGRALGRLEEVLRGQAHDVYVVPDGRREVLLPAVREVVGEVSVDGRRITVRLPPGLEEA
ncbi:MAG: 16S rRNA processing protein RimM, partial [candidate division GAL15 bacterium]